MITKKGAYRNTMTHAAHYGSNDVG